MIRILLRRNHVYKLTMYGTGASKNSSISSGNTWKSRQAINPTWVTYRSSVNTRQKQDNTGIKRLCHRKGRITGIIDRTDAAKIPYVVHIKDKTTQIIILKRTMQYLKIKKNTVDLIDDVTEYVLYQIRANKYNLFLKQCSC